MSIATIVSGIGAFIGGGFGIGKIVGAFKKLGKIKKIIAELLALKKEGMEVKSEAEKAYKYLKESLADGALSPEEAHQAIDKIYTVMKEWDDVQKKLDDLYALFK